MKEGSFFMCLCTTLALACVCMCIRKRDLEGYIFYYKLFLCEKNFFFHCKSLNTAKGKVVALTISKSVQLMHEMVIY